MEDDENREKLNGDEGSQKKESVFSRIKQRREEIKLKTLQEVDEETKKDAEIAQNAENVQEQNEEDEKKQLSPTKKKIFNIVFLVFNILLVVGLFVYNIVGSGDFTPLNLLNINVWAILIYILLLVFATALDTLSVHLLIYRKTYRNSISLSYQAMAIGRHYDNVIPFTGGGQAFMSSFLRKRDIPGATSYYIPMSKLISLEIGWLLVALFCLINSSKAGNLSYVGVLSIIGFVLGVLGVSLIIFVSVFKRFTRKLISWGCKLLFKMKIIKDYDKTFNKINKAVEDYQNLMRDFTAHKLSAFLQVLLHIVRYVVYYSIPFVIYCIFNGFPATDWFSTYLALFISAGLIELSASFIPLPGGSGMNEISFTVLFSSWLGGETFWALILWRFFNYYSLLLQGIGVITYSTVYGDRKYLWSKKRNELQAESAEFKKSCIDAFRAERIKRRKKHIKK